MKPCIQAIHIQYLMANEVDHLWGNVVNTVGFQHIGTNENYPPANHPTRYRFSTQKGRMIEEYQLVYIVKGGGTFQSSEHKEIPVREGNVLLLFPGEWHNYRPYQHTGWEEYWIGFNGAIMNNRVQNGFFDKQMPVYDIGIQDDVVQLYKKAIETAQNETPGFQQKLSGFVSNLLGLIYSLHKNSTFEQTEISNKINKAKTILSDRFNTNIPFEEVAEQVKMSYSWFRHSFKEYTGFSPNQYVLELRIQKSKTLLTNSLMSIKEIAYHTGFDNSEYYATLFRKKTEMTPGQYRRFTQGKLIEMN